MGDDNGRLYSVGSHVALMPLDVAIEAAEEGGETTIGEYRPPNWVDVDCDDLTDLVWQVIDERLAEDEILSHEDGGPTLTPSGARWSCERSARPAAWHAMWACVRRVVRENGYFGEAAWVHVRDMTVEEARCALLERETGALEEGDQ